MSRAKQVGGQRLEIRPARIEDYDSILALWTESDLPVRPTGRDRREAFARHLTAFRQASLVAEIGDRIVGVVLGSHDGRKGWINRLAVKPEHRRRGIAARLIARCEAALAAAEIEIIAALVEGDNESSARLFESLGFREYRPIRYYRKLRRPDA